MKNSTDTFEHKYIKERKLEREESGKNKDASIVYSLSRKTGAKKYWVAKPFGDEFDLSDRSISSFLNYIATLPFMDNYRIYAAALEVYFGHLAAEIFGKEHSPKTKFNLEEKGIVSRVIGNEFDKCINFRTMLKEPRSSKFTLTEQIRFLDAVLYGIIIGDRDINPGNLVVRLMESDVDSNIMSIYAVDHEFALGQVDPEFALDKFKFTKKYSLVELLKYLHMHPKDIAKLMCGQSLKWNNKKAAYVKELDVSIYKPIEELLADSLTSELFIESLSRITQAISRDDYNICYAVQRKIEAKISRSGSVYTPFEISVVIKIIIEAVAGLKKNIEDIEIFLTATKTTKLGLSLN